MLGKKKKKIIKAEKKVFSSISNKLVNIDEEIALEYLSWLDKKTTYFRNSVEKSGYGAQPDNLKRGDIVWVEFGINVGTELSDFKTKGHYALVWAIDLGNVIVIPLSSRDSPGSEMTFDIGTIPELNEGYETETHSYLKLDAIRSISKRRVSRMAGFEHGKVVLSDELIRLVSKAIELSFLNNEKQ